MPVPCIQLFSRFYSFCQPHHVQYLANTWRVDLRPGPLPHGPGRRPTYRAWEEDPNNTGTKQRGRLNFNDKHMLYGGSPRLSILHVLSRSLHRHVSATKGDLRPCTLSNYFRHRHPFSHTVPIYSLHVSKPFQYSLTHYTRQLSNYVNFYIITVVTKTSSTGPSVKKQMFWKISRATPQTTTQQKTGKTLLWKATNGWHFLWSHPTNQTQHLVYHSQHEPKQAGKWGNFLQVWMFSNS